MIQMIFWDVSLIMKPHFPLFRHGIIIKEVSGKSKKVTKEISASWEETILPTILTRYQLSDIYNADEFDLFCKALSSKTLHFRKQRCSGRKHSKVRITGMAICNALGENIPMFVVGKSVNQDGSATTFEKSLVNIVHER